MFASTSTINQNIYFQKQQFFSMQCGLHAVNNFLGQNAFKQKDFQNICKTLSDQIFNSYKHFLGGDYDVSVLIIALQKKQFQIEWHDKRKQIKKNEQLIKKIKSINGFLLNVEMPKKKLKTIFGFSGRHWISIKVNHFQNDFLEIIKMDSFDQKPKDMSLDQLIAYLQKQRRSGTQILQICKLNRSNQISQQAKQILPKQIKLQQKTYLKSSSKQSKSPPKQPKSPAKQPKSPAKQPKSPAKQPKSPMNEVKQTQIFQQKQQLQIPESKSDLIQKSESKIQGQQSFIMFNDQQKPKHKNTKYPTKQENINQH